MLKMDHELVVQNVDNISLHTVTPENTNPNYLSLRFLGTVFQGFWMKFRPSFIQTIILVRVQLWKQMFSSCLFEHISGEQDCFLSIHYSTVFWSSRWLKNLSYKIFIIVKGIYLHPLQLDANIFVLSSLSWMSFALIVSGRSLDIFSLWTCHQYILPSSWEF